MKKSGVVLLLFLTTFFSCGKKEEKLSNEAITYKVMEVSAVSPVYSVMYTGDNGITVTEGGLSDEKWSKTIQNLKSGTFISFTLESTALNGSFKVSIYKGSTLLLEDSMDGQQSPLTWNGTIP